ncbi:hypothetical protein PIB30_087962 [Stylosanthes scabra]|uniref:Uncharacterized protein n=1 Tax=Stylosanthes scabra TaxID=79078 RepID=A0ABU6STT8_9FABA|nr:hypothetical protein [Stylosanthes scabra]
MGKKMSYQDVREPQPLNEAEIQLYGWVEEEVFTQPSAVLEDSLFELRHNIRWMGESGGDYVLEVAGSSNRVPFRAEREGCANSLSSGCQPATSEWIGFFVSFRADLLAFWVLSNFPTLLVYL